MKYVGRLAPSPSGHLHVGHAQTFWVAYERARRRGGQLIMRVEDIDVARCKPQYTNDMLEDLRWFGINWTHGYDTDSPQTPSFVQSKRFPFYEMAWKILYDKGYIYPCKLSRKDVETALSAPHDKIASKPAPADSNEVIFPPHLRPDFMQNIPYECLNNDHFPAIWQDLNSPLSHRVNWRFRVPDEPTEVGFDDAYQGPRSFQSGSDFGDFLVWRLDGYPSYELAVVVDDILMGITEVVRGEDLLLSTARQLLLMKAIFGLDYQRQEAWHPVMNPSESSAVDKTSEQEAPKATDGTRPVSEWFSAEALAQYRIPRYFHSPLVCDENGVRLAKRSLSKSLRTLRSEGLTVDEVRSKFLQGMTEDLF